MIIFSVLSFLVPRALTEEIARRLTDTSSAYDFFMWESLGFVVFLSIVLLVFIAGGGICALIRKAWWWALSGAIGCVIIGVIYAMLCLVTIPSFVHSVAGILGATSIGTTCMLAVILAIIFLTKRRDNFG